MTDTDSEIRTEREAREKVWSMIKDIRICLMVTQEADGQMRSRPMAAQQQEFDGELWFFTAAASGKVHDLERSGRVLLGYADTSGQNYVSITGHAQLVRDRTQIQQRWSELLRTWFPKGPDDPAIALIRVRVETAEYWDSVSSTMVHAYGYIKARLTGSPPDPGDHGKVEFV